MLHLELDLFRMRNADLEDLQTLQMMNFLHGMLWS